MHYIVVSSCIGVQLSFMANCIPTTIGFWFSRDLPRAQATSMIKKRSRPQPRVREVSPEAEEASNNEAGETGEEEKLE